MSTRVASGAVGRRGRLGLECSLAACGTGDLVLLELAIGLALGLLVHVALVLDGSSTQHGTNLPNLDTQIRSNPAGSR